MKKTGFWIAVIAVIFAVAVGALLWQHLSKKDAVIAEIYVEGRCERTIDLSEVTEPETFKVVGAIGTNTVLVEPGRICITEADCPDHVCIQMGWLSAEQQAGGCKRNGRERRSDLHQSAAGDLLRRNAGRPGMAGREAAL